MKPEELIKKTPESLWIIEINGPAFRTKIFSNSLELYVKEIKIEKRTPQGWKGSIVMYDGHVRVFSRKNYMFFGSEREAHKALLDIMKKRRLELSHLVNSATSLINFINVEVLNAAD